MSKSETRLAPALIEMRLENFKIHKSIARIGFKPITILIGPNSCGKTALLQPLLMLKQSMSQRTIAPISLNGESVNLGTFNDIVTNHDNNRDVTIGCTFETNEGGKPSRAVLSLDIRYDSKEEKLLIPKLILTHEASGIRFAIQNKQMKLSVGTRIVLKGPIGSEPAMSALSGVAMFGVLALLSLRKGGKPVRIESDFLGKRELSKRDLPAMLGLSSGFAALQTGLERMRYIGPLRDYPQRFYSTSGEKFSDVGKRGERAIEIVYTKGLLGDTSMKSELTYWLRKLGVAHDIRIKKLGGGLYSLILRDPVTKALVNIADAGFGVSQIVPIIIECCLLDKNNTLILEQPEIHIHPLGQMVMADLMIRCANEGKRFIVETHSEHLLLRIQRRVAEKKLRADQVAVYYFEPKGNTVVLRDISVDQTGGLVNLPPGFMDERLEEAYRMALASE